MTDAGPRLVMELNPIARRPFILFPGIYNNQSLPASRSHPISSRSHWLMKFKSRFQNSALRAGKQAAAVEFTTSPLRAEIFITY